MRNASRCSEERKSEEAAGKSMLISKLAAGLAGGVPRGTKAGRASPVNTRRGSNNQEEDPGLNIK